ncbi:signal peptidase II [bacterium]|nr:signal peptidase II [candidate division CSSED10-310 bacterium]
MSGIQRMRSMALLVMTGIVILDQITKLMILGRVSVGSRITVIPGCLDITHVKNPGAAFGFMSRLEFPGKRFLLVVLTLGAVLFMLYYLYQSNTRNKMMAAGLTLVVAGALGNLIDRIFRDGVVDFILVYIQHLEWPSFNIADSAISAGILLLLLDVLLHRDRAGADHRQPAGGENVS